MADENIVDEVVDTKTIPDEPRATLAESTTESESISTERVAPVDWPDNWREKAAGGDAKKLSRLSTYASPQALADALISAQNRIAAGDLKPAIGKDAKPEDLAAFRAAHGIPESPDKYDLGDYEVPAEEKPLIEKFLSSAHSVNMTPDQVKKSLEAYSEISEQARNERYAQDEQIKKDAEDKLRAEWGADYRTNLNLFQNLLSGAPEGLRDKLLHGRLADGTPIGSSVEVLQFLVGLERERNPAGVVVSANAATTAQSVAEEKAKIEKVMREDRTAYNRDQQMQDRYLQLIRWEEAQRQRAA
jgi:hypothetical protein